MSSNPPPTPPAPSEGNLVNTGKNLFEKLSLGGKLLCGGALLAIISAFLAEFSVNIKVDNPLMKMAGGNMGGSSMVIEDWRGVVAVLCCVAGGVMAIMLLGGKPPAQARNLTLIALGAGGVAVLMSILIWVSISRSSSGFGGMGAEVSTGAGIGAYLIIVASIACLAGSVLNAKDAKVF